MYQVPSTKYQYRDILREAKAALQRGERRAARRWAERAVALEPENEEGWLLLAAVAAPRASVTYLNRALRLNPSSRRARKGLAWALQRLETRPEERRAAPPPPAPAVMSRAAALPLPAERRSPPWLMLAVSAALVLLLWAVRPLLPSLAAAGKPAARALAQVFISPTPTPTATFTPTPTFTPTATFTSTPTPTPTDTSTPTPTFTATPTATATDTPAPTATPPPLPTDVPPTEVSPSYGQLPPGVEKGERWIDVDLTHQRTYAYQGKNLIQSFVVSTGVWQHPTVTGQYRIYVKYEAADMAGPGYYLPAVPYVMYFYRGYGLHGTYWHHNFGTPMSHGCINLRTEDARWLFNWASVGTLVNIHY